MVLPRGPSSSIHPRTVDDAQGPFAGPESSAVAGWASLIGGLLLGWPFIRGIAGELPIVTFLLKPGVAPLASASLALGPLVLAFGLVGWWRLLGHSVVGRASTVVLGIGLVLMFLDEASFLAPEVVGFPASSVVYFALIGIGSLLLPIALRRLPGLPRDGLVLIGLGGPAAAVLLGAPWPLGLGAIVPAIGLLYALGWIRVGIAVLRVRRRDSA